MKKLMITATLALAAVALQAADIKWGARNIYIPVAKDAAVSETGIIPTSGDKFAAAGLTVSLFWVDSKDGQHKITDLATTGSGLIAQATLGNDSSDKALYTAMLAEGSDYVPSYAFTATYADAKGTYT